MLLFNFSYYFEFLHAWNFQGFSQSHGDDYGFDFRKNHPMKSHFKAGNVGLSLLSSIEKREAKILRDFGGKSSNAVL